MLCRIYGVKQLKFGPDYLIPKPFDPRVLLRAATAVAKAAIDSGVSQEPLDLSVYEDQVSSRMRKWVNGETTRV